MSTTGPHTRLVQYLGVANTITCGLPCAIAAAIRVWCKRPSGGLPGTLRPKHLEWLGSGGRGAGAPRPARGAERHRQGADAQSRRLDRIAARLRQDLEAPGAGTR